MTTADVTEIAGRVGHDEIADLVGPHEILWTSVDEHGRELVHVEYRDARRGFVRRELDGSLTGPHSQADLDDERAQS